MPIACTPNHPSHPFPACSRNARKRNLQLYAAGFEVVNTTILAWPPCPEVAPDVCAHNTCVHAAVLRPRALSLLLLKNRFLLHSWPRAAISVVHACTHKLAYIRTPSLQLCSDAIDVHGSPAWIHHCYFSVGDDNVAMHSNDTLVEDNLFGTGHGARCALVMSVQDIAPQTAGVSDAALSRPHACMHSLGV